MTTARSTLSRAMSWHRPLMLFAGLMVISTVVSLVGLLADDRVLVGDPIWLKPFKFSISLMIYAVTWAWLLSLQRKRRRWVWWASTAIAVLAAVEMVVIIGQVLRGEMSHFNVSSAFNAALFSIMGFSIVALWGLTLVQGIVLLRDRIADPPIALAIRAGVLLGLVGMALAFFMTGPTPEQMDALRTGEDVAVIGAHSVGVADGGQGMPITGWSTTGGDLRIPHFVGIHAMQALPLFALGLTAIVRRFGSRGWLARLADEGARLRLVWVAASAYAGLLALVTWQALRGQPLLAPDAWTLLAVATLLTGTAIGVGVAVSGTQDAVSGAQDGVFGSQDAVSHAPDAVFGSQDAAHLGHDTEAAR